MLKINVLHDLFSIFGFISLFIGITIRVEDSDYAGTEVGETIGAGYPAPDDMATVWLTEPLDS
ncbi:MAG: hypothetical protein SVR94_04820 [Pseudomonadota bacterium]|nr:hypothetical protein [Pseudomonadota bacterium]